MDEQTILGRQKHWPDDTLKANRTWNSRLASWGYDGQNDFNNYSRHSSHCYQTFPRTWNNGALELLSSYLIVRHFLYQSVFFTR